MRPIRLEFCCQLLGDIFGPPCQWSRGDTDFSEVMTTGDDGEWCEEHCTDEYTACWYRFFDLMWQAAHDSVDMRIFNVEEIHENCTVQIWRNTVTGEQSFGWWPSEMEVREEDDKDGETEDEDPA